PPRAWSGLITPRCACRKTSSGWRTDGRMVMKRPMVAFLTQLLLAIRSRFTRRARLEAENLLLRQQLVVLRRKSPTRGRLRNIDRLLLVWLYRLYPSLLDAIIIVQPETVIRWHRRGFRAYWRWKSRRVGGELLMLGIKVAESTVGRYMVRRRRPPSQGWRTFLRNHAAGIASLDLFVVHTISFKLFYGLVILRHARRRLVAISVTSNPTAEWIAGQVTDGFPWDEAPRHLVRDRDGAFGPAYTHRIRAMGIRDHPTAARSPWQNGHVELLIGSIRRESPRSLGRVRRSAVASRSDELRFLLQPGPDASLTGQEMRPDFRRPQKIGRIAAKPILGGLHHQYVRV